MVYFFKNHFETILDCLPTLLSPRPSCRAPASGPLCPGAPPFYGFHTLCGLHTEDWNAWKSRWEKEQDLVASFCLTFQPYRAPGNLLLFSTSCVFCLFFPIEVSYWAGRLSLTKHTTRYGAFLRVCAGSSSSWSGSSISGASSVHLHMEAIWGWGHHLYSGSGCWSQAQVASTQDAGLRAADRPPMQKKPLS